jgi:ribosomal protein S18 acetylase RimI-like enzyme
MTNPDFFSSLIERKVTLHGEHGGEQNILLPMDIFRDLRVPRGSYGGTSQPIRLGYNSRMTAQAGTSISLRPATPGDAEPAAALIYETALTLGDYIFGQSGPEGTTRILAVLFREKGHLFSFQCTTLALSGGEVVGLVQALPAATLGMAGARLVRACAKCFGLGAAIRMAWRSYPLAFEPDAKAGEYYVDTLAVAPARRNRGIGRALLEDAERRARELGFPVCSLSVMLHNTNALRFYRRAGYREDLRYETKLRAPGVQYTGFHRMIKPLSGGGSPAKGAAMP